MQKIKYIFLSTLVLFMGSSNVLALQMTKFNTPDNATNLASVVLGDGISLSENFTPVKHGTVYEFSDGKSIFGIKDGIVLDTSGDHNDEEGYVDTDLDSLMDYVYGHTTSLEFELIADGELLNFNFAFASREFDQSPEYNDVFGLFVSVNDGPYENIAKITRSDKSTVPVNITNLRAGLSGTEMNNGLGKLDDSVVTTHTLFTVKDVNTEGLVFNGISNVFNAKKKVQIDDKVRIKFAIADVSDDDVDSYVLIQKNSLSFIDSSIDYKDLKLYDLNSNVTYLIKIDGTNKEYELTSDQDGTIPLKGKDNKNQNYNFIGKKITIKIKGSDAAPQTIKVLSAPGEVEDLDIPSDEKVIFKDLDIETERDKIIVRARPGEEYSIDGVNYYRPTDGIVIFDNLDETKEYYVYARYYETDETYESEPKKSKKIILKPVINNIEIKEFNYEGLIDDNYHYAYITTDNKDAVIKYSLDLNGKYTSDIFKFKDKGKHVVYYSVELDGYYTRYGKLYVNIKIENPQTLDNINIYILTLTISFIGMFSIYINKKRFNN